MLLALLLSTPASALEIGLGGYGGYLMLPDGQAVSPGFEAGGRLRFRWSPAWGVEAAVGIAPGTNVVDDGGSTTALDPRLELLYFFDNPSARVTPFVAVGPGLLVQNGDIGWMGNLGGGLDVELVSILDLRADLRLRVSGIEPATAASADFAIGLQFHNPRVRDSDGDGVSDKVDGCREVPEDKDGFQDEDGCVDPDNDGDTVMDADDRCQGDKEDIDGFEDVDGCADPDNDKDGVADTADKCATELEDMDQFEDGDGCADADNDKDGIADAADKAPNEPETFNGYKDRDGIPDEVPAEVKRFSGRIEGILFKTNSAEIDKKSYAVLDAAVAVLQQFPEVRMEVQGHTDDVGDDAKNMTLSQDRAQSVVNYLISKGVAADRLVAKGYGETKPEVPNDSKENQSRNRRVEFQLIRDVLQGLMAPAKGPG